MIDTKEKYSITELSKLLKVTDHTLRYYEKEFKLPIPRDSRGRRYYTNDLVDILRKIKDLRNNGIEIRSIKETLPKVASNYVDINKSTKYPLTEINEYYISLQENMEEIKVFLRNLDEDIYTNISSEIHSSTIQIITTLNENMENLSGYMESNTKLLDYKLEKHFNKVDSSLSEWRNKNKGGVFKQLFQRLHILIAKM
jgi:DNA-binding transcriptional MerR regulator